MAMVSKRHEMLRVARYFAVVLTQSADLSLDRLKSETAMTLLFANAQRMIAAKSRPETCALAIAGFVTVAALAYLHTESMDMPTPADRGWAGQLATVTPAEASQAQTLSSAALVVPKSHMALPPPPEKPVVRIKSSCDSADLTCMVRPPVAVPPRRRVASLDDQALLPIPGIAGNPGPSIERKAKEAPQPKKGLLSTLNPLNHLPDMSSVGKPISAAGRAVTGWIKFF